MLLIFYRKGGASMKQGSMKLFILTLMILFSVSVSGCSVDKAKDLMDTALLEEKQHNPDHARQLYQEIIQKYPDSAFAKDAQKKLSEFKK
jgi:TolA-binding protein